MVDPFFREAALGSAAPANIDTGLRTQMQRVFNYMAGGLAITGLVAYIVANTALAALIFGTPLRWVAVLAPFVLVLVINAKMASMSASSAKTLFWTFCGTMGLSLATIFLVYTEASVARAFFITSATFASMSLWGYTTKRDLTGMGAFLMMGVMGLFIAMIVNMFLASDMIQWISSVLGVLIFTGLTAYDVQRIKMNYHAAWGEETNHKLAVMGALSLYTDFINAFLFILRFVGNRR